MFQFATLITAYCTLAETTYLSCNYTKVTTCEIFIVLKVPDRHSGWWLGLCGQYTGGDPSQPLPSCLPKLPIFTVYNIQWKHYFYYIYINIYIWKFWFWCLLLSVEFNSRCFSQWRSILSKCGGKPQQFHKGYVEDKFKHLFHHYGLSQ